MKINDVMDLYLLCKETFEKISNDKINFKVMNVLKKEDEFFQLAICINLLNDYMIREIKVKRGIFFSRAELEEHLRFHIIHWLENYFGINGW